MSVERRLRSAATKLAADFHAHAPPVPSGCTLALVLMQNDAQGMVIVAADVGEQPTNEEGDDATLAEMVERAIEGYAAALDVSAPKERKGLFGRKKRE